MTVILRLDGATVTLSSEAGESFAPEIVASDGFTQDRVAALAVALWGPGDIPTDVARPDRVLADILVQGHGAEELSDTGGAPLVAGRVY